MAAPVLVLAQPASAAEEILRLTKEAAPVAAPLPAPQASALTLADCIQIALDTQPALKAAHASLGAAESGREALDHLRIIGLVSREIPVRRKQAALGVGAAAAGVSQAEWETIYAVTRNFFTVQYARIQQEIARAVIEDLKATYAAAKGFVEGGSRTVTKNDLVKISTNQARAEIRLQDAVTGVERALAALREAMGVCQDFQLNLASIPLPRMNLTLTRQQAVAEALARRGELVQAMNVAEVTCLEVEAQGVIRSLTARTFAAGADLHARPIPQGEHNGNYRPDALGVEMPTTLAGHRKDRVNRAREFNVRANAVVEKTRNLIALEAEDSFLKWQRATANLARLKIAAADAVKLGKDTQQDFAGGQKVTVNDVLESLVLGAQTKASYNEALYEQILALAALERVTAGGVSPGWGQRPASHR
jgi:outer membrane protein TolC